MNPNPPSAGARRLSIGLMAFAVIAIVGFAVVGWGLVGVHRAKLEPAYRAAQALNGSTTIGITYPAFLTLLQQFQTELSIARDKRPTKAERVILDHYAAATETYTDSLALWKKRLDGGQYLSDYGEIDALKVKYRLPVESTGTIDAQTGLQVIWAKAAADITQGNALYAR